MALESNGPLESQPTPNLPELDIVPTEALLPHEYMDERRAPPLIAALRADGMLRNPPVVLPVGERPERYVVLDGANRTTAFRSLAIQHCLVQIVHAGDATVQAETWNHVISCMSKAKLVDALERFPDLALVSSDLDQASFHLSAGGSLAYLALPSGDVLEVVGETEPLAWRVANLNRLVDSYKDDCQLERTSAAKATGLDRSFPDISGLMVFPRFDVVEIVHLAASGLLLPSGLTRFIISPRALRVNYALDRLTSPASLEEKRAALREWTQSAVAQRRVRYYAEATFLFDEG